MKKILLIASCLVAANAWAGDCTKLSKIAEDNGQEYGTKYSYTVQGKKGFRTYFHSAPSSSCRLNNTFIIPNDSVIAYSEFKNENKTWLYVMFIDKNGKDATGWVISNDFKISGRFSSVQ